jgi:RNA polymerase sigma factor (TIGR02999 family)
MNKKEIKLNEINAPITELIQLARAGDTAAQQRLWEAMMPLLKEQARDILSGDKVAGVMRPSDLLQDALLRMVRHEKIGWNDRQHLFKSAAKIMRHIVVDQARKHLNPDRQLLLLDESFGIKFNNDVSWVEIDEILNQLAAQSPIGERQAGVVELRVFARLSNEEIASTLDISLATVKRDWVFAAATIGARLRPTN